MPRNGSNVYSPPADTLATTLTTIKSPNYNAFVNDVAADLNLARPIVSGGTGATSVASAQTALSLDNKVVYASKSGNYTALATDNNAVHRYTAAATVTLTAAATIGANWHYTVTADGGAVTIDPNASETINGLATLIVPNGSSCTIVCDGSTFFTVIKPNGWQFIEKRDFSAASAADFTNLAAYRRIRMNGYVTFSGSADLGIRFSSDNGSSFVSTSSYGWQVLVGAATTAGAGRTSPDTYIILSSPSPTILHFNALIDNMSTGATLSTSVINSFTQIAGGNFGVGTTGGTSSVATAKNAIRLFPTAGTMTGNVSIEGMV